MSTETKPIALPATFGLYFQLETMEDLEKEIDYLTKRLSGLMELCSEYEIPIDGYVFDILPEQE